MKAMIVMAFASVLMVGASARAQSVRTNFQQAVTKPQNVVQHEAIEQAKRTRPAAKPVTAPKPVNTAVARHLRGKAVPDKRAATEKPQQPEKNMHPLSGKK